MLLDGFDDIVKGAEDIGFMLKVLIGVSIAGVVLPWFIKSSRTANLSARFKALGNMSGLMVDQVIAAVGKPSQIVYLPNGRQLTWSSPGYMIVLLFDVNGIFVGIQSEHS